MAAIPSGSTATCSCSRTTASASSCRPTAPARTAPRATSAARLFDGFTKRYLPGPGPIDTGVDAATAKLHAQQIAGYYDVSRAAVSNFLSLVYLLGEVKVVANDDGTISIPMLAGYSGAPKKWREISPYVWQDTNGNDRLAAQVTDGKVTRFTAEPIAAIEVFERTAWWSATPVLLSAFFGSLAVLLLTVLAWPLSALVRRHYGVRYALSGIDARAHRGVRLASLAVLLSMSAILGGVLVMMSDLDLMTPKQDVPGHRPARAGPAGASDRRARRPLECRRCPAQQALVDGEGVERGARAVLPDRAVGRLRLSRDGLHGELLTASTLHTRRPLGPPRPDRLPGNDREPNRSRRAASP